MSFNEKFQEATEYAQKRNYEESIKKFKEASFAADSASLKFTRVFNFNRILKILNISGVWVCYNDCNELERL